MSKRRAFGDIVQVNEQESPFMVRLVPTDDGAEPDYCVYECGDEDCREWRKAEIVREGQATGELVYHIPECHMSDPA
jgi:hypothetical protein